MMALRDQHCRPQSGAPLSRSDADRLVAETGGWTVDDSGLAIHRAFRFRNFYETMAFVNLVAWIANQQDHHPDLEAGYNRCTVRFSTHSVGGLSENDFICAARINSALNDAEPPPATS